MSELREEAAIAREALVRDKKKTKQQTTLSTKWNIVLDYGESGVGMAEFCGEYNDRQGKAVGVVLEESKLCRWKKASAAEDWEDYLALAPQVEKDTQRRVPQWWRKVLNAEHLAGGGSVEHLPFPKDLGRPSYTTKYEVVAELVEYVVDLAKQRIQIRESVKFKNLEATLKAMIREENAGRKLRGEPELPCKISRGWVASVEVANGLAKKHLPLST